MQHPVVATTHQRYHIPNLKRALEVFEVLAKNGSTPKVVE